MDYVTRRDDPVPLAGQPIRFDDRAAMYAALPRLAARFYEQAQGSRQRASRSWLPRLRGRTERG
jgi:hypothetical protein